MIELKPKRTWLLWSSSKIGGALISLVKISGNRTKHPIGQKLKTTKHGFRLNQINFVFDGDSNYVVCLYHTVAQQLMSYHILPVHFRKTCIKLQLWQSSKVKNKNC